MLYGGNISAPLMHGLGRDKLGCVEGRSKVGSGHIVLLERGQCEFEQKVLNAQYAGAIAAVVFDNVDETLLQMSPSQVAVAGVVRATPRIPSLFISKSDGQWLQRGLANKTNLIGSLTWPFPQKLGVEWELWSWSYFITKTVDFHQDFDAKAQWVSLGMSTEKIDMFMDISSALSDSQFTPRWVIIRGDKLGCSHNNVGCSTQCTNNQRYCSEDVTVTVTGGDLVAEAVRQICVWKANKDLWWPYVKAVSDKCASALTGDCSQKVQQEAGIDTEAVQQCVADSGGTAADGGVNTLLEEQISQFKVRGLDKLKHFIPPTMVINGKVYSNRLDCPRPLRPSTCSAFAAICAGFESSNRPDACLDRFWARHPKSPILTAFALPLQSSKASTPVPAPGHPPDISFSISLASSKAPATKSFLFSREYHRLSNGSLVIAAIVMCVAVAAAGVFRMFAPEHSTLPKYSAVQQGEDLVEDVALDVVSISGAPARAAPVRRRASGTDLPLVPDKPLSKP
jgi:hypothetical protein